MEGFELIVDQPASRVTDLGWNVNLADLRGGGGIDVGMGIDSRHMDPNHPLKEIDGDNRLFMDKWRPTPVSGLVNV
jgi:hypothetical protein